MLNKLRSAVIVAFVLSLFLTSPAGAMPNEMNYQGKVTDAAGILLNGTYDIKFSIYNAPINGNKLWNEQQSVQIIDGVFNVNLGTVVPFPEGLFTATFLGLEVAIYNLDSSIWETLGPLQRLTSTAYAFRAADADTLNGFDSTAFLSSDEGLADLDNSNMLVRGIDSFNADNEEGILYLGDTYNYIKAVYGSGVHIGSFEADDALTIQMGSGNVGIGTISPGAKLDVDGTIQTSADVGGYLKLGRWSPEFGGSALSTHGGSTFLSMQIEDEEKLRIQNNGNIGIGTESPQARLHISGAHDSDNLILGPPTTEGAGQTYRMRLRNYFGDGFLQTASGGPQFLLSYNSYQDDDSTWHATYPAYQSAIVNLSPGTIRFQTGTDATNPEVTTHMKIQSNGHVIVGQDTKYLSMFTDGLFVDILSSGSALGINYPGDNDTFINIGGGRVGVGTADPTVKLDVVGNSDATLGGTSGVQGKNGLTGNIGSLGNYEAAVQGTDGMNGNFGALGHRNWGARGDNAVSGTRGYLGYEDYGVLGHRTSGVNGYLGALDHAVGGEHIRNELKTKGLLATENIGVYGWINSEDPDHAAIVAVNAGAGPGLKVLRTSLDPNRTVAIFDGNIKVDGKSVVEVLEITGGSDLSEYFDISHPKGGLAPIPGSLVSIDPQFPGKLVVSQESYDRKVAGIISGAGGVATGLHMGQKGSLAHGKTPIALTGRVYCLSDASNSPIAPGDLLTTSNTPGHAMKVTDHAKALGAILGKAMSGLDSGQGLVLVLVSLQ